MAYVNNGFCWHAVVSRDPEATAKFYSSVLGWSAQEVPMGEAPVTTFFVDEIPRIHQETVVQGQAPHWSHYLRVDDVDARTEAAVSQGGSLVVQPTDIPPGRFSVVKSPSGAVVHLFHEADEAGATNPPRGTKGAVHWVELWSGNVDRDATWLRDAFGFELDVMQMPNGPYTILKDGEEMRGGAVASSEGDPEWLAWIHVDDVDATVRQATALGGRSLNEPFDVPNVGRLAVLADPEGARFGIITPPN